MMQSSRKPFFLLFAILLIQLPGWAQTFRGTVSGTVSDATGAVITDATVQLTNPATGVTLNGKSNKAGEFRFPELPVGIYDLSVTFPGFETRKVEKINVAVTLVENIPVILSMGAESTVIDVAANGVQTDTVSSALVSVIDSKSVQEMPMNGRNFTQMVKFVPGVNISNSVNGSRTASINYQVDGTDNVDAYLGIVASNQGGIASVAGGLIPIEAIDQFSMQAAGEADQGRNAGANSNMVLRSGTNQIHGDVFYFDRNEFFASISPVAAVGSRKPLIRNHQGGFTLGGPIWRDHTFLFTAGEIQVAKANVALTDTVLSDAWIAQAQGLMANFGVTTNPISQNLYKLLFPAESKGGPATANNYFASGPSNYNSFNGVVKLDQHFSDKFQLSMHYIGTTGKQTAPTGSDYAEYFQTAPMHIHNISVVQTSIFSPRLLNTVTMGANYFKQTFNDADQNFSPQANAGLSLGLTGIVAAGAPTITVNGFDIIGATQPSGRTDVTGHVTDNFHWNLGRHSLKFGGEFRRANVDLIYFSNARGSFTFDGTRGPWTTLATGPAQATAYCKGIGTSSTCNQLTYIADFLLGLPTNSNGAKLLQGNAERTYLLDTEDGWVQDDFQVNSKLSLNLGVRYTVPGVVHDAANDLYSFVPGTAPGFQLPLYNNYKGSFGPRFGFSYAPFNNSRTVIRGSYGLFYDVPGMSAMVSGTTTNGGDSYTQNNPAGPNAAVTFIAKNVTLQTGVNPFVGANPPQLGAFGVQPSIRTPYAETYSFGFEQQISNSTLVTVGYVGTAGHRLLMLYDLNQPVANGTTTALGPRPYPQTTFPGQTIITGKSLNGINQLNNAADSNYNSLQVVIKQAPWHGIQTTFNYTWAHSLDDGSSTTTPMNSYNIHQDYGNSTFDTRNTVTGFVYYNLPQLFHALPRLSKGWQTNALYTFSGGTPISPLVSTDRSGTNQLKDRPNYNNVTPYAGRTVIVSATNGTRQYQYLAGSSFSVNSPGTYGNLKRDNFYGPGFGAIDFSLFKRTPISEKVTSELRVECFNLFNQANLANPSVSNILSTTFGRITQTRNGAGAPGLGYGEPRNVQFALKVLF